VDSVLKDLKAATILARCTVKPSNDLSNLNPAVPYEKHNPLGTGKCMAVSRRRELLLVSHGGKVDLKWIFDGKTIMASCY
jgi:hypothetical protein